MVFEAKLLGESWAIEPKIIERVTRHPFFRPMFEPSEFSQTARLVTASVMQIEQKVMFETSTKMTPQKDEYKELRRRM